MKKRVLSVILFAVSMVLCSCKMNLLQSNASIKISLPYGNARAGEEVKYSFIVDCFKGNSVSDYAAYSQKAESGQQILFEDVIPAMYTVRVRAFEYNNFENLLYEGSDTKNVIDGAVTNFLINLSKITSKGFIDIMKDAKNKVWLQIQDGGKYCAVTDGANAKAFYWYLNGIFVPEFTTESIEITKDIYEKYLRIDNSIAVVAEFEDGTYDSFVLNNFLYSLSNIIEKYKDLPTYNVFLKSIKTEGKSEFYPPVKYDQENDCTQFIYDISAIVSQSSVTSATMDLYSDPEYKNFVKEITSDDIYSQQKQGYTNEYGKLVYYNIFDSIKLSSKELTEGFYFVKINIFTKDNSGNVKLYSFTDSLYLSEKCLTNKFIIDCLDYNSENTDIFYNLLGETISEPGSQNDPGNQTSQIVEPVGGNEEYLNAKPLSIISNPEDIQRNGVYSISTEEDLQNLANWSKDTNFEYVTFILTQEIVLSSSFTPIGNSTTNPFMGKFDGQGNTISYNNTTSGLFSYVGPNSYNSEWITTIQNLTVAGNISLDEKEIVGSIVGDICGPCVIDNCISKVNVSNTKEDTGFYIGGICGKINSLATSEVPVVIKNCINIGNLTGYINIGGIVGHVQTKTDIYNCANYGTITFSNDKAGGIIGGIAYDYDDPKFNNVTNCFNAGTIRNKAGSGVNYGAIYGGDGYTNGNTNQITNLLMKSEYCYYLKDSCNYTIAGTNLTDGNKIESVDNAYSAITQLNNNILHNSLGVSDAKKWSTNSENINGIDVYLFE